MDKGQWSKYPIGTRAITANGGYWERTASGWRWCTGSTFPAPGGDVCKIVMPSNEIDDGNKHDILAAFRRLSMDMKGSDLLAMLGIESPSLEPGAWHVLTRRGHRCGEFRDVGSVV